MRSFPKMWRFVVIVAMFALVMGLVIWDETHKWNRRVEMAGATPWFSASQKVPLPVIEVPVWSILEGHYVMEYDKWVEFGSSRPIGPEWQHEENCPLEVWAHRPNGKTWLVKRRTGSTIEHFNEDGSLFSPAPGDKFVWRDGKWKSGIIPAIQVIPGSGTLQVDGIDATYKKDARGKWMKIAGAASAPECMDDIVQKRRSLAP